MTDCAARAAWCNSFFSFNISAVLYLSSFEGIPCENANELSCILSPHGGAKSILKSSAVSPVALRNHARVSEYHRVPHFARAAPSDCTAAEVIMAYRDFVPLCRTAAKRPVVMLLFGHHLKISWPFCCSFDTSSHFE